MTDDALLASVRAVVREEIERALAQRRRRRLSKADYDALSVLLPILLRVCGTRIFTVGELATHAALPGETMLRETIAAVGGSNRVGRLLKRAKGHDIDGVRVDPVGEERAGILWRVSR